MTQSRSFDECIALITGGGRGIGAAVARKLGRLGAYVYVNYNESEDAAGAVLESIRADGGRGEVIRASVRDADAVAEMITRVKRQSGRLDLLVNNAGITRDQLLGQMPEERWHEVVDTNLTGVYRCTRHAVRLMLAQRFGRVVNMGSVSGFTGAPGQTHYSATKAGIVAFTRSLAFEVGPSGIRVNCVVPGLIETEMATAMPLERRRALVERTAIGRMGSAQEVAEVVAFLLSDAASYVHGAAILVDGGLTQP